MTDSNFTAGMTVAVESDKNITLIMNVAKTAARLTLRYGGGTNRAEDICVRICRACGADGVEVSAVTTSITITFTADGHDYTSMVRVCIRDINLSKLNMVNCVSRALANHQITPEQAMQRLEEIQLIKIKSSAYLPLASGFAAAFFSLLLGGGAGEFAVSFFVASAVNFVLYFFQRAGLHSFINNLVGGIINSALAILFTYLTGFFGIDLNLSAVIIGAMMPLLPGLTMTNAIKDTINGDYVSGGAGVLEALSMAVAVAAGSGLVISFFVKWGVDVL